MHIREIERKWNRNGNESNEQWNSKIEKWEEKKKETMVSRYFLIKIGVDFNSWLTILVFCSTQQTVTKIKNKNRHWKSIRTCAIESESQHKHSIFFIPSERYNKNGKSSPSMKIRNLQFCTLVTTCAHQVQWICRENCIPNPFCMLC